MMPARVVAPRDAVVVGLGFPPAMNPALAPAPPPAVNGTVRPAAAAAPPGVPPPKKHKQRMGQRADQDKVARDERGDDTGAADREEKDAKKPGNNKASATTTQYVDHTYTDFAIVGEDDLRLLDENSALLPNPASSMEASTREKLKGMSCTYGPMKKNAGGVVQPFPGKLLEVLYRSDLADSIVWMSHGRAFIVKKPKLFTTDVLPRFFKQTKFLSFTRQLNLWGFKRISRGLDAGCYYHELFLRGRPYLPMRMRRQKIKGTGMKLTPNPDKEPDFYNAWPVVPPLHERRGAGRGSGGIPGPGRRRARRDAAPDRPGRQGGTGGQRRPGQLRRHGARAVVRRRAGRGRGVRLGRRRGVPPPPEGRGRGAVAPLPGPAPPPRGLPARRGRAGREVRRPPPGPRGGPARAPARGGGGPRRERPARGGGGAGGAQPQRPHPRRAVGAPLRPEPAGHERRRRHGRRRPRRRRRHGRRPVPRAGALLRLPADGAPARPGPPQEGAGGHGHAPAGAPVRRPRRRRGARPRPRRPWPGTVRPLSVPAAAFRRPGRSAGGGGRRRPAGQGGRGRPLPAGARRRRPARRGLREGCAPRGPAPGGAGAGPTRQGAVAGVVGGAAHPLRRAPDADGAGCRGGPAAHEGAGPASGAGGGVAEDVETAASASAADER